MFPLQRSYMNGTCCTLQLVIRRETGLRTCAEPCGTRIHTQDTKKRHALRLGEAI